MSDLVTELVTVEKRLWHQVYTFYTKHHSKNLKTKKLLGEDITETKKSKKRQTSKKRSNKTKKIKKIKQVESEDENSDSEDSSE